MCRQLKWSASILAITTCILPGAGALAQAGTGSPAAASDAIETVVVTAEHRAENIQNAPVAIASLSGEQLRNAGITNLQQLTQQLPAVQFARAGGPFALFFLRGVGSFAANSLTDSAVQVGIDSVPIARQYGTGGQMYDLDRVEVLKGPQGTLDGSNATGGAVNIIPMHPQFTDEGYLGATVGSYDTIQTRGMYNAVLADGLAIRGAFQTIKHSGYLTDGQDDEDDQAGRLEIRYDPTESLSFNLSGDLYHQGGKGGGSILLDSGYTASDRIGLTDPRAQAYYHSLGDARPNTNEVTPNTNQLFIDGTYAGIKGGMGWTNGLGALTAIAAYRKNDVDSVGISGPLLIDNEHDRQHSFELREAFDPWHGFQITVGGYYLNDRVRANYTVNNLKLPPNTGTAPAGNTQAFTLETESKAIYADATYALSDSLKLLAGIRYSNYKKTLNGTLTTFAPLSPINPVNFVAGTTPSDPSSWDSTTWRAGVQWDITKNSMAYATVSTGFHSGGFFLTHDNPSFQPETIKAYTLGTKNRFINGRLQVNLEAFYWLYHNQQLSAVTFDSKFSTVFQTFNAASSHIQGAELSIDYLPSDNTLLTAQMQYLDSKYQHFSFKEAVFAYSHTSQCTGTFVPPAFENVSCAGLQLPNSPEWTINLGAQQTFPLSNDNALVAAIHEHYQSETYLAVSYLPTDLQKAYWMGDLSLAYQMPERGWTITAFINNFTDEAIKYSTNHAVAGVDSAQLSAPRIYGVSVTKDF